MAKKSTPTTNEAYELYRKFCEVIPEGTTLMEIIKASTYMLADTFDVGKATNEEAIGILEELKCNVLNTMQLLKREKYN